MLPAPFKPIKLGGLYPGSGVAPGGQQGRIAAMHGGIAARRGGANPRASQPRPPAPIQIRQQPQAADYNQLLTALMQTSIRPR